MRKPVQVALLALLTVLLITTAVLFVRYRNTSTAYETAKASEASTQERYAKTIDAIAEIQDSLNAISMGDANVKLQTQLQSERKLSGPDSRDALDQIALLRSSIMRNKDRILQLERSLKTSGNKVAGLQRMLAGLKQNVAEKEQLVAELTGRVDSLQTQVTGLAAEVQDKSDTLVARDQTIEDKRRENATVFYVVGNKTDLTKSGVVVAKGGLLGIGKTLTPSTAAPEGTFAALDTDQQTVIDIGANKAQVISAQPSDSYELRLVDGKMQLHILNPLEFRKIKQVVILTA